MNAKVIASSFLGERAQRIKTAFPQHAQHIGRPEDVIEMLDEVLQYEQEVDAGVPVDTFLVLNGESHYNYAMREWDGRPTWNGTIRVLQRPNVGGSFGAYNHAFQQFKDTYDYWLFTEDDIVVGGEKYYKRLLEAFDAEPDMGFLALIERANHPLGVHAHGGVGLSRKDVLEQLPELPHYKGEGWDKEKIIYEGEVPFTNEITKLGYSIGEFCPKKDWDFENKLCLPYYDFHALRAY
jgi:hypothetical protein